MKVEEDRAATSLGAGPQLTDERQLALAANRVRQNIVEMLCAAGSGHSGGPLGMADVFTTLYFGVLNIDPHDPARPDRDRVLLSNGHICPVWYAVLAERGYFPTSELNTLRQLGTRLQGHTHIGEPPGVENSSGPLGQGLSQGVGLALAARLDKERWRTHVMLSDGEHNEGQIWEAILFAGAHRLANLTAWIDRNYIQIDGDTEDVLPVGSLAEKYRAFNWHVLEIDGHNHRAIIDAAAHASAIGDRPTVVVCHTIPGKGVDFMERDYRWHGIPPNREQADEALKQLRRQQVALEEGR
ncbi:MAG TPA: transketolase [Candidatus Dormibacteraeota bacterium]|nr:transketolase [Candidatus Dormibacteraeota bacterium]